MSTKRKTLALFVFIDAFGWELYKKYGFMQDKIETASPLGTILGYSATCIPSILTGKKPEEHGHFSFFYYDPVNSPFKLLRWLRLLPENISKRGRFRNLLSKILKKYFGYTGYFQLYNVPFKHISLFDYSEKKDLYRGGGINSGAQTIFDYLDKQQIQYHLSDWRASEETNISALKKDLDEKDISLAYLYLPNMDALLHVHGTDSIEIKNKVQWYEEQLNEIHKYASDKYEEVRLHVFSDHGMKDITEIVDLIKDIEKLDVKFGQDYVAVYDSTMARFWFFNEQARESISKYLNSESCGRILSEQELSDYGCLFQGNTYGEMIYLMNPGTLICPSFMGHKPVAGMHGYAPEDPDSIALYASNTKQEKTPADLTEMFNLMVNEAELAVNNA